MEVPGPDSEWRSPAFRQKVVAQIEEAMRKAGSGHIKSSNDMENHVFIKAKSRDEYLSLVARLIIHFRDIYKKAQGGPDPMNALQTLTGVGTGGPGGMVIGPRPPGAQMGNMGGLGQMQMAQHGMQGVPANAQSPTTLTMEVPGPDSAWRSPAFRQKVVAQIEEAMRKAGSGHIKSSNDMENHVFVKAKSRDEYLSLVARLIIHFRDIHKKAQGGPDPMNALQTLTGVGTGGPPPANTQSLPAPPIQMQPIGQQQQNQQQQFQQYQAQQQQNAMLQQQTAMQQQNTMLQQQTAMQQQFQAQLQQQQQQQQAQNQQQQQQQNPQQVGHSSA